MASASWGFPLSCALAASWINSSASSSLEPPPPEGPGMTDRALRRVSSISMSWSRSTELIEGSVSAD
eukprot:CAMPEP_0184306288 /NCGR_PEP_ID=MMETSP1049-20130417/15323_1 /TAXON_ID=77928 /ORGANISM="Proteomonas sulcata, Strain CCMP704" /LENGTH=66 /DNA_ID=CAMNT_0026618517 /DNA_START=893 /DNA_END=1093 /DNA_ORIENTATION=-